MFMCVPVCTTECLHNEEMESSDAKMCRTISRPGDDTVVDISHHCRAECLPAVARCQ